MAYKTMLRQLISKWGIMSIDMQEAMVKDMSVVREDGTYDYVDNNGINLEPIAETVVEPNEELKESQQEDSDTPKKVSNLDEL